MYDSYLNRSPIEMTWMKERGGKSVSYIEKNTHLRLQWQNNAFEHQHALQAIENQIQGHAAYKQYSSL